MLCWFLLILTVLPELTPAAASRDFDCIRLNL